MSVTPGPPTPPPTEPTAGPPPVVVAGETVKTAPAADIRTLLLDVALGGSAMLIEGSGAVGRRVTHRVWPVARIVLRPPGVPARYQPGTHLDAMARRGQAERLLVRAEVERVLDALVPSVSAELLQRLDMAALRTLVEEVIDAIDLPEIMRQSTGSMASDTVRGARMQAIAGDEAVSRLVDRLWTRRGSRAAKGVRADDTPLETP